MNALMSSLNMNASMNSLNQLNLNAPISLSQLILFSSKARKQLLQTFDPEDRHIAQALRSILDDWEGKSKKQRAQLYEHIQTMCVEAEENEVQAQKELNLNEARAQEEAQAQKKTRAKEIAQEGTGHSKLPNDDDDLNEIHRMCKREMTRQQARKLVWPEWPHPASSASSSSSASPVRNTREFAQLSARKPIVSPARSPSRSPASSSASSSLRSSSARDLQRTFTQIAPLSPASSVPTSASVSPAQSPARDARDLRRKPKQRPSVSPPRSPPRTYPPHDSPRDSPRSSPRYSPARDSRRTPIRNASVSLPRSPRIPHGSWRTSSPRGSPARTPLHGSSIKPCLSVENLYVMFHRPSGEEHAPQGQRQRAFPGPTYRLSAETSISTLSIPSPRSLKRFLQRSKAKLSSWIR